MAEKTKITKFGGKRVFLLVGLTILILTLTVFRQTILKTIKLIEDNQTRREKLATLSKKVSFLADLDQNRLEKRVGQVEQVFPSKKPALELLTALRSLSAEDEVSLGSFTLKPGKLEKEEEAIKETEREQAKESKMQDFHIDFVVNGEFSKVSQFIKDLERTAPLAKIESLDISFKKPESDAVTLQVGIGVRIYYQSPPVSIPPIDRPIIHLTAQEEEILDQLSIFKFYPLKPVSGVTLGKKNLFEK